MRTQPKAESIAVKDPATARGRRTRDALITAARTVFEDVGYIDARVSDITAAAGVAYGTFYIYFVSKEDVLHAVIEGLRTAVEESARQLRASPSPTPFESIAAMNRSYVSTFLENSRIIRVWAQVAEMDDSFAELFDRQMQWYIDRADRSIRRLQDQGRADAALDPRYTAEALCSMVFEFCVQRARQGQELDLDRAVATLSLIWARGIGVDPTASS